MYNALETHLARYPAGKHVLLISEGSEPAIRSMFPHGTRFTATTYPPVDITDLSAFGNAQFDCGLSCIAEDVELLQSRRSEPPAPAGAWQ